MINNEEEIAIKCLKNRLKILHNNTQWATEESIKIVLNLIDKQQKEIEELNKTKDNIQVVYDGRSYGKTNSITKEYISKDKIIEILDKEREKAKERYDSRLDISKQIYKKEVQIAMIDTIKNKLLKE